MAQRIVAIWFRHLRTDWWSNRRPELKTVPFVLAAADHGRKVVVASNAEAEKNNIYEGMTVADAKAMVPSLEVLDNDPDLPERLLKKFAEWCIRYTPVIAVDGNNGLLLNVTGCAHLWGGELPYLREIVTRLKALGYDVRVAIADTIGTAWAVSRYGTVKPIIESGAEAEAIAVLPPAALRLAAPIQEKLRKLGLHQVGSFMRMQRSALRRRFGPELLLRLDQALGIQPEIIEPFVPVEQYQERLPCLEPIQTRKGIEIAIERLLEQLCKRLQQEGKGLRKAVLKGHRVDGEIVEASIGTSRPSHHVQHLFKLFELEISTIKPELGIELFILEVPTVEEVTPNQETMWNTATGSLDDVKVGELLDRLASKIGSDAIHRYLPDQHYWPERSIISTTSLTDEPTTSWPEERLRPVLLLPAPELIQVTAPMPDYPPMLFRYRDKLHTIKRADGPERIEAEWWLEQGPHRDYYQVEDTEGKRYWVFRSGHYDEEKRPDWYIHGFFA